MAEVSTDWKGREIGDSLHSRTMVLNLGPSHPCTHGTARLVVELNGERIERCDVDVGYLHRGFEKQCENVTYLQVIPYTDRLNYVSPIINNVGYCLAVEKLFAVDVPERTKHIRVIMSEVSRLCDHLTCLGASAMELGAFTVFLYMVQARELLWQLIESVTGARLTISYVRPGGLAHDLPTDFTPRMREALTKIRKLLDDCDKLLEKNRIFIDRMCNVGVISPEEAVSYGLTGPILRASTVNYDVRKVFPYSGYEWFDFEVPLGTKGDNYDRYVVRFQEMYQSMRIIEQSLKNMPDGPINIDNPHVIMPPKDQVYGSIEGMISQFEIVFKGIEPPKGEVYFPVEGGNGELGFYLVSDGTGVPYRCRVRPPAFISMGVMGPLVEGHMVADVVPIFGMINMIGGECDR
ncbi:NADH-quinone oxidoreductase subunit D [bacterium]|nr:NADH-quinone oxidoreductase subunit D [bacterium]